MAKFRFKLDALLRLRELEEQEVERRFQEVDARFRQKENEIDALALERDEAKQRYGWGGESQRNVDIETVLQQRRYINSMYQRILERGSELRKIGEEREIVRKELIEASTRKKVVEKLRERRFKAFQEEENRKEQRMFDELGQVYSQRAEGEVT